MNWYMETLGEGPPMLMVHGWGMNGRVWHSVANHFARQWEMRLVDLPGHGQTPAGDLDLATTVASLSQQARVDSVWIGWSLGGLLTLAAAAKTPPRAMVLIGSGPCFVQRPDWIHALKRVDIDALSLQVAKDPDRAMRRYLSFQISGTTCVAEPLRFLRELSKGAGNNREALLWWLDVLKSTDQRSVFGGLTCPLLVVLGEHDPIVPVAVADDLAALNPRARIEVIAGAAHAPFLSHTELLNGMIEDFLRDV